jgi:hypothetical protein
MEATTMRKPLTKPGQHGALYRYTIEYTDECDNGFGVARWNCWAYNVEHALDKFDDGDDGAGWKALRVARVNGESSQVRWQTVSL